MKKNKNLIIVLAFSLCILTAIPVHNFAAQVKTNDGRIATSVGTEKMETAAPISAPQIAEGTYDIDVTSSSSMFRITACRLTVSDGQMTANLTLSGTAYLKLYMGTDSEAAAAPESECIPYTENTDGSYSYTVPVVALNKEIDCAAFSSRSSQWYPRKLIFQSSSLPEGTVDTSVAASHYEEADITSVTKETGNTSSGKNAYKKASEAKASEIHYAPVSLADGKYKVKVSLTGGSGKASIDSPTDMTIKNGHSTAQIQWSSPNYDYMVVDGLLYEPINEDGNSVFEIPVTKFDGDMKVIADTTAMSQPHEIEYTLDFDSGQVESQGISTKTKGILMLIIILAVILAGFFNGRLRSGKVKYDAMNEEAELERLSSAKQVSKKKKKLR